MTARRMIVVLNPRGGTRRGHAILQQVTPVFAEAGVELDVHVTEHSGHARELAETLDLEGRDGLCVIGGDGTIHEVADGLLRRTRPVSIPLGFIPAGSGNTLHQHLQCTSPLEAARRIVAGGTTPLDAARVTMGRETVHCVDIIGWGGVADINGTAEALRVLGPPRYAVAALAHVLRAKRRRARITLDGQVHDDEYLLVIACNTKYTGKGMKLAPLAEINDGKIDVVLVRKASRWQMLQLFKRVFDGSHLSLDCVEYHQVRSLAIESEGREPLDLDGEMKGTTPLAVEMMPAALRVFA